MSLLIQTRLIINAYGVGGLNNAPAPNTMAFCIAALVCARQYKIFVKQKKLVFFAGVALLGLAIPWVGKVLETVIEAVHG